jgi:hypothetical protein
MRQGSFCGMLGDVSSKGHMPREGEGTVIRQGHLIAVVAFLIGCAVLLVAGASGVQAQASKKEQARFGAQPGLPSLLLTNTQADLE